MSIAHKLIHDFKNEELRILLIRPSALGDVCRTVPALVTLRKALPHARIDWLVQDQFIDAVSHHPDVHEIIPFPRKQFHRLWWHRCQWRPFAQWLRQLRRPRYDMVIDLQGLARSGFFTRVTGAPLRLGFANAREGAAFGYNQRFKVSNDMHTVDRMLRLLELAGFEPSHDMRLYVGEADQQWAADHLAKLGADTQPVACLAPTAQWRCKCWPLECFEEIGRRLRYHHNMKLIVLGAPGEQAYLQPLLEALDLQPTHTTVGQMMALLRKASFLLCNDSGPLHMAVGLKTPVLGLFGPTDPKRVGPYRQPQSVITAPIPPQVRSYRTQKDDQSLIRQISLEQVWETITIQLAKPTLPTWPTPR